MPVICILTCIEASGYSSKFLIFWILQGCAMCDEQGFKGLKTLICSVLLSELDADGSNVYLAAIDYDIGNKCAEYLLFPQGGPSS